MSDAFAPTGYTSYLAKRAEYYQHLVHELMSIHDPGGTVVEYPEWIPLSDLVENQKDLDPAISKLIDDHFWELGE